MMIAIELMLCAMLGMIPSIIVLFNEQTLAFAAEILAWVSVGVLFTIVINKYRSAEADASASEAEASEAEASEAEASEAEASAADTSEADTDADTDDISALKQTIEDEREKTRRLQSVVYQMMGKLYEDERDIQTQEVDYLYGKTPIGENENINVDTVPNEERIDQCTTLEDCIKSIAELKAELKEQDKKFSNDGWSFNELFMRMHDVEERVDELENDSACSRGFKGDAPL